jgi:hypothetical protein
MFRTLAIALTLVAMNFSPPSAAGQERALAGTLNHQAALRHDLDSMTARLNGARPSPQQMIADAQLLTSRYHSLGPLVRGFGPADYAYNREAARRSLEWLARASLLYGHDALVAQALLGSYDSIGGFYTDYGPFYQPGAFVAYAGATRLAQRLVLERRDPDRFEREFERFALAYGTIAAFNGALLIPWNVPRDLPESAPQKAEPIVPLTPVELPSVNVAALDAEQKAAWNEVKDRFRNVSPRVHGARVLLNELSARLQRQNMTLHPQDAANALKMQSFLEEAVELIREGRFETASEALVRADYVRARLKGVTGQ